MLLCNNLCVLFLLFSTAVVFGQSKVDGTVYNEHGNPLSQVTISLKSLESGMVNAINSNDIGKFLIEVKPGTYDLKISFLGYTDYNKKSLIIPDGGLSLGSIDLIPASSMIEEIQIKAGQRLIERKSDRLVVNIENSILADGMTALEILQRVPSVNVDDDGNISLRGKSDVAVMINGKLSYLGPKDLAILLKGTQSSSIKSIELITNPSAKYDAQGMGGMINIVMKNEKKAGYNLSVNTFAGAGRKERYGAGFNFNTQVNKWNFNVGYDRGYRGEQEYRNFDRFFEKNPTESQSRKSLQYSQTDEPLTTNNAKAGIDFQVTEKLTLGMAWTGSFGTYENFNRGYNNILFLNDEMISNSLTNNSNISKWNTNTVMANIQQTLGKREHLLSLDLEYMHADYKADQELISDFQKTPHQNSFLSHRKNKTPSLTKLYVGKIDYLHHLSDNQRLELGWKSSAMNADNNAINDTLATEGWVNDRSTSNHFLYQEDIHAAYGNYHLDVDGWNVTAGVRMESTNSLGNQLTSGVVNERKYTNWFPSASVSKKINDMHSLQLSYSKRINRPDYEDLNPFRYYVDAFVFYEGNPLLQPELANSFELNYSFGKNLHAVFYYTDVKDVMTSVLTQLPEQNITIRSIANIEGFKNKGLNLNHTYKPVTFWTIINNGNIFENHYFGTFNNEKINNREWSYSLQTNHVFKMPKNWSIELNGQYNSSQTYGVFQQRGTGFVSAGLMKSVWDNKLSLKLAANDIFKTMNYQAESFAGGVRMNQSFDLDTRTILFSATLKIGKDLGKKVRDSSDEKSRVRGGN